MWARVQFFCGLLNSPAISLFTHIFKAPEGLLLPLAEDGIQTEIKGLLLRGLHPDYARAVFIYLQWYVSPSLRFFEEGTGISEMENIRSFAHVFRLTGFFFFFFFSATEGSAYT